MLRKIQKMELKKSDKYLKKKERHLMMSFPDLPKPDRKVRLAANIIKTTYYLKPNHTIDAMEHNLLPEYRLILC